MENLCSGHVRASRLSTLAQAAECLAKAAVTLSEAARAAAETFSSELLDVTSALNSVSETGRGDQPNGAGNEYEECTNPEDTDYYLSDDDEGEHPESTPVESVVNESQNNLMWADSASPMSIGQLGFDSNQPPPTQSATTEVETVAGLAYRVLVDAEVDVLLFVCALIQNRRKAICYMNCSIPAFHMYKKFINDVTATDVFTITKTTNAEITEIGQKFLEADRSILLLPETTTPSIEIDEIDSWVVHVGWPSDEQRYEEQRLLHQAQNTIIVACSEDEELYPAGTAVMWQSQPWPGDVDSFRVSVASLRPVFEQKLALIPAEMKAKTYPDWISCHGPRGHRHVKSWDAVTLVKKANSFLLDVLKYKAPESESSGWNPQNSLPEVSEGFMVHNCLELAVRAGVLRVKVPGSGLNHVSSLPEADWVQSASERGSDPPTSAPAGSVSQSHARSGSTSHRAYKTSEASADFRPRFSQTQNAWGRGPPIGSHSGHKAFKPTTGLTYFTLDEEFEAIPLMCFLANTCAPNIRKSVLFFDLSGCQAHYKTLVECITGWRVFAPENAENNQSNEDAASNFAKFQEPAILLLHFKLQSPPAALTNVSLGYCVYWGSTLGGFVPILQSKKHRDSLKCQSTSIIMTTTQASKVNPLLSGADFKLHPSSTDLRHRDDSPWLSDLRTKTRSVLVANSNLIKSIYEGHLRSLGKSSGSLGATEVAGRINRYTANVLLTGDGEDGSSKYPPISGRLVTPLSIVNEFKLQAAMNAGMLYVW